MSFGNKLIVKDVTDWEKKFFCQLIEKKVTALLTYLLPFWIKMFFGNNSEARI